MSGPPSQIDLGGTDNKTASQSLPPAEKPLRGSAKFFLVLTAALAVGCFYLFFVVATVVLLAFLAAELILFIALLRFGVARVLAPFLERHSRLLMLILRSVWIPSRVEFQVPITEDDAPALFEFLRELSRRTKVPPPRQVLVEMNAGAWVRLRGVRRGANATTLGLGYDLIAGLTEREIEAVLAHEMAHAKFVRRGLKRLLNGGLARAVRLAGALSNQVEAYRRAHQTFELAQWLLAIAHRWARLCVRLVAAYSRQDEFEADIGAAEICGAAPLRSSLLKLDRMAAKAARIGWNERVAQLQRGDGFGSWLAEELQTGETGEVASSADGFDPYSTHPSLHDRLAALPPDATPPAPGRRAIELLARPDAIAARLVNEIHRVAQLEERRDDRELRRWLKKIRRGAALRPLQWLGALIVAVGLIVGIFAWAAGFNLAPLAVGIGIVGGGVAVYRYGRHRFKLQLPVPEFETLKAAWDRPAESETYEAREKAIGAELDIAVATFPRKKQLEYLRAQALTALGRCQYVTANVAARRCQDRDRRSWESLLLAAIASAGMQRRPQTIGLIDTVAKNTGLRGRAGLWGAAWSLVLVGEWFAAEATLQELQREGATEPTLAALLAICQARRNKIQSAIAHARTAFAAAPGQRDRLELLVNLLVTGGFLTEAEQLLQDAGPLAEGDLELGLARTRLLLLRRDFAAADARLAALRQKGIRGHVWLELGGMNEGARRDAEAEAGYRAALAEGFFPAGELGLARLALHRGDKAAARQHVLAAMDSTRPLGEKAAPAIALLAAALGVLLRLENLTTRTTAWTIRMSGNAELGPFASRVFLVFAQTDKQAEAFVRTAIDASKPGQPSLRSILMTTERAPDDRQPVGAVREGIQAF